MAHTDVIPDDVLDRLEQEIRSQFSTLKTLFPERDVRIGDSYQVWKVVPASTASSDPRDRIAPTERWQHEILSRGESTGFARSIPASEKGPKREPEVEEIFHSDIAQRLSATRAWIDENVEGDPLLRLLDIPAFRLLAFWLSGTGRDEVVPAILPRRQLGLNVNTRYSLAEFFGALERAEPIVGFEDGRAAQ